MTPEQTSQTLQKLLELSQTKLDCGADCQHAKQEKEWEDKLVKAKENAQLAPIELQETEQQYYAFLGQQGTEIQRKQLEMEAQQQTEKMLALWEEQAQRTHALEENTQVLESQYEWNQETLSRQTKRKSEQQKKEMRAETQVFTNQRRVYYVSESLARRQYWGMVGWVVYFLGWIVICIWVPGMTLRSKIAFAILPFAIRILDKPVVAVATAIH